MHEHVLTGPEDAHYVILRVHRDHDVLDAVAEPECRLHEIPGDLRRMCHVEPASDRGLAENRASRRLHEGSADRAVDLEDLGEDAVRIDVLSWGRVDSAIFFASR